jgi:hypothetical protein
VTVVYGSPESLAYVVAIYACGCGRTEGRHGREAGTVPPGWVVFPGDREPDHLCPDCARSERVGPLPAG